MRSNKGYTLIELIATIALLAIIAVISFVSVNGVIKKNKIENCHTVVNSITTAANEYVSDYRYNTTFVNSVGDNYQTIISGSTLLDEHYLNNDIIDPYTKEVIDPDSVAVSVYLGYDYAMRAAVINTPDVLKECDTTLLDGIPDLPPQPTDPNPDTDKTPPIVLYDLNSGTYKSTQTLHIEARDTGSGVDYMAVRVYKDGEKIDAKSSDKIMASNFTVELDDYGVWKVLAYAYDNAGNKSDQKPKDSNGWYYQEYTIVHKPIYIYYHQNGGVISGKCSTPGNTSGPCTAKNGLASISNKYAYNKCEYGSDCDFWNYNNQNYMMITKEGYAAVPKKEWCTSKNGEGHCYNQVVAYTYDQVIPDAVEQTNYYKLTVYVNWQPQTYTIHYYQGNGTSTDGAKEIGTSECIYRQECTLAVYNDGSDKDLNGIFPYSKEDHAANSSHTNYYWSFVAWSSEENKPNIDYTDGQKFTYNNAEDLKLYAVGKKEFEFYSGSDSVKIATKTQYWNPYSRNSAYFTSIKIPASSGSINSTWSFCGYKAGNSDATQTNCSSPTYAKKDIDTYIKPAYSAWPCTRSVYSRTLTVSYNGNNGTGTMSDTKLIQYFNTGWGTKNAQISSNSITLASNGFTYKGYTFAKWAEGNVNGTEYASGVAYEGIGTSVTDTTAKKTMYAKWKANKYYVHYYQGNGTSTAGYHEIGNPTECTYGKTCKLATYASLGETVHYANTGWKFYGWGKMETTRTLAYTDGGEFTYNEANDISLYVIEYRNVYFASGAAPTSTFATKTQYWNPYSTASTYLSSIDIPAASETTPMENGWTFRCYRSYDTASSTCGLLTSIGKSYAIPVDYYVNYRSIYTRDLTLTYKINGGTGTLPENITGVQYHNSGFPENGVNKGQNDSTVSFTLGSANDISKPGYSFDKWAEDSASGEKYAAGETYKFKPVYSSTSTKKTMYATWTAKTYTIHFRQGNATSKSGYSEFDKTLTCTYGKTCKLLYYNDDLKAIFPYSTKDKENDSSHNDYSWVFAGWSDSKTGTAIKYENGGNYNLTEYKADVYLYAVGKKTFHFLGAYTNDGVTYELSAPVQYWNPYSTSTDYMTSIEIPVNSDMSLLNWTFCGYIAAKSSPEAQFCNTPTYGTNLVGKTYTPKYDIYPWTRSIYKRQLTLSYNANSGSGTMANTTKMQYFNTGYKVDNKGKISDNSITLAANGFTYKGYTFTKWAEGSASGTQYAAGTAYTGIGTSIIDANISKTMYANWVYATNTPYKVKHYVHDLGTNTYTLKSTDNLTGTTNSTVTLADLAKTISGFTYVDGYITGDTTKPTSGAKTTTTILADGTRVINLYYRRNYLRVKYHVNGGSLAEKHGEGYSIVDSIVTRTSGNTFWRGVYGGTVSGFEDTSAYVMNTSGLDNYNNSNYINLVRVGYVVPSGSEWCTGASGGTCYSQASTDYKADGFAGADLSKSDQTVTLYLNWKYATNTPYKVNHYVHDLGSNTYTLNSTDNLTGTTNSTVTLEKLKKSISGFTYVDGYITGGTTKPTSGATATTTILADGTRVINLYYRRNYLYIQYHVNGGSLAEKHGEGYGVSNSLITRTSYGTTFWRGVYGGKVGGFSSTSSYTMDGYGLDNYNSVNYINLVRAGYTVPSGSEWCTSASGGTCYSQASGDYDVNGFAGANLSKGDQTVTLYINWKYATNTPYKVNHYVHDLGSNTYTLNSTDNLTGTTNSTVTLEKLKKSIAGFTYVDGYITGGTTKPTSGATTTTTILADGTRVINLYYRRNYLYIKYHVNGGKLADKYGEGYSIVDSIVTRTSGNTFWRGVYGGNVSGFESTSAYVMNNSGLDNYNNSSYMNLVKTGYTALSGSEWCTSASGGTCYSQTSTDYKANTFAGADLSKGDQTVTLYLNWVPADVKYVVKHYTHNLGENTYTLNSTENKTGIAGSTVTLADLAKTISGFTYFYGYKTDGGTTKPTSGSVTTTTILEDGTRVISLYYRRNRLYIQYNVNGGTLSTTNTHYGTSNSLITEDGETKLLRGVYGSKVGNINSTTYVVGTAGLINYNNSSYVNIVKSGYIGKDGYEWNTSKDGTGTGYDQDNTTYNANGFAGADLSKGDQTVTLYVNWVRAVTVSFDKNYFSNNLISENPISYNTLVYVNGTSSCGIDGGYDALNNATAIGGRAYAINVGVNLYGGNTEGGFYIKNMPTLVEGQTYTVSYYIKNQTSGTTNYYRAAGLAQGGLTELTVTSDWQKVQYTFTATKATDNNKIFKIFKDDIVNQCYYLGVYMHSLELIKGEPALYSSSKQLVGNKVLLPDDPERSGYSFVGWYTKAVGGTEVTSGTVVPNKDVTYYAHWANNGSGTTSGGNSCTFTRDFYDSDLKQTITANCVGIIKKTTYDCANKQVIRYVELCDNATCSFQGKTYGLVGKTVQLRDVSLCSLF